MAHGAPRPGNDAGGRSRCDAYGCFAQRVHVLYLSSTRSKSQTKQARNYRYHCFIPEDKPACSDTLWTHNVDSGLLELGVMWCGTTPRFLYSTSPSLTPACLLFFPHMASLRGCSSGITYEGTPFFSHLRAPQHEPRLWVARQATSATKKKSPTASNDPTEKHTKLCFSLPISSHRLCISSSSANASSVPPASPQTRMTWLYACTNPVDPPSGPHSLLPVHDAAADDSP